MTRQQIHQRLDRPKDRDWEKEKKDINKFCEICGKRLEREPESGVYYCPECDEIDQ